MGPRTTPTLQNSAAAFHMNPEYTSGELHEALSWATSSLLDPPPFCAIAVYPSWKMEKYMSILTHTNVSLVTAFYKFTFSFLSQDHWEHQRELSPAQWMVMVIEISNEAGQAKYRNKTHTSKMNETALLTGVLTCTGIDEASANERSSFHSHTKSFLKAPEPSPQAFMQPDNEGMKLSLIKRPPAPSPPKHLQN